MLYAYGATVIEIVRRKEFCKQHHTWVAGQLTE